MLSPRSGSVAARRIMVVEDEAIVAFDIQTKLEEKGYGWLEKETAGAA